MKPRPIQSLRRKDLPLETVALARYLIGKTLVRDLPNHRISGRIVETEAYVVGDASCHAFRGETPRNRSLFLEHGHAYVCLVYGTSYLLNISSEAEGVGAGVLFRAVEPLEGTPWMEKRRGTVRLKDLARGPGRLSLAFGIDKRFDGLDLCTGAGLWLGTESRETGSIGTSVRIGLSKEAERPLRFFERDNPFVSGPKALSTIFGAKSKTYIRKLQLTKI